MSIVNSTFTTDCKLRVISKTSPLDLLSICKDEQIGRSEIGVAQIVIIFVDR